MYHKLCFYIKRVYSEYLLLHLVEILTNSQCVSTKQNSTKDKALSLPFHFHVSACELTSLMLQLICDLTTDFIFFFVLTSNKLIGCLANINFDNFFLTHMQENQIRFSLLLCVMDLFFGKLNCKKQSPRGGL